MSAAAVASTLSVFMGLLSLPSPAAYPISI